MKLEGERIIQASRAAVWQALNDAEVLRTCIPGCDELEKTSATSFEGQVTQKVGPVKAKFKGGVTLSDVVEGESYRIDGEGKGGAAGFAKGGADVSLTDDEDGATRLAFDAEVKVGGKLAQLGNRLIDGFARKMADQFFDRFKEEVERPGSEGSVTPPVDQAPDELVAAEAAPAVVADQTAEEKLSDHPLEAPGAAGPTTREEPVSGASGQPAEEPVEGPEATAAGAGPAGGTEAPYQAAMAKRSAEVAARQDDPDAEDSMEQDPAKGPPDAPASAGTDGVMGGAGSDPARVADKGASDETPPRGVAPEGPKKAAPKGPAKPATKARAKAQKKPASEGPKTPAPKAGEPEPKRKSWFERLFSRWSR